MISWNFSIIKGSARLYENLAALFVNLHFFEEKLLTSSNYAEVTNGLMVTQSLKDRLVYPHNGTSSPIKSSLPPECALIVLTSTLATPCTFILNHYLHETLKTNSNDGAVFLSFHYDFVRQALQLNKLV
jgi:hypothetical protein